MSRALSIGSVIEKNKIASAAAFVLLIEIDVIDEYGKSVEIRRLCRNDEDITYQGNVYTQSNFELDLVQEAGSIPEIQIVAIDYTRALMALMAEHNGGIGFAVTMTMVNSANLHQAPEIQERFKIVRASAQGYVVTFTLGAENPLSMRFPKRRQTRDRCQWRFKGPECGYKGSLASCDLSLQGDNGCAVHKNTLRFGAFPGLQNRGA